MKDNFKKGGLRIVELILIVVGIVVGILALVGAFTFVWEAWFVEWMKGKGMNALQIKKRGIALIIVMGIALYMISKLYLMDGIQYIVIGCFTSIVMNSMNEHKKEKNKMKKLRSSN